jgi:predicted small secreted protein
MEVEKMKRLPLIAAAVVITISVAHARDLSEQEARRIAAKAAQMNEAAAEESYLVTRGETNGCGRIQSPTWVVILKEGPTVYVDARTGKVRDCRQ